MKNRRIEILDFNYDEKSKMYISNHVHFYPNEDNYILSGKVDDSVIIKLCEHDVYGEFWETPFEQSNLGKVNRRKSKDSYITLKCSNIENAKLQIEIF